MGICQGCSAWTWSLEYFNLIMLRRVKFYKHLFLSANSMLYNVFNFAMCRAVLVDRPSFLLLYIARTDLGVPRILFW